MKDYAKPSRRKPPLAAIDYIRGISMLGVIGIHVGSVYVMNPLANEHLMALLEIFTRFSVPIFFFISAFGLFYNLDPVTPFSYGAFLKRRWRTVLVPYLVWSLFYITCDSRGQDFPSPGELATIIFFGNAKYQLYFMVILLWFYLLMPLWIWLIKRLNLKRLAVLFILQLIANEIIESSALFLYTESLPETSLLKPFLQYRLNYWVLPYVFIFVLGGYLAVRSQDFKNFLAQYPRKLALGFLLALAALLGYYYYLIYVCGYSQLEAIYTAHQLSPPGLCYTLGASLFFFMLFTRQPYPSFFNPILAFLGRHSYFAYLAHPFFITILTYILEERAVIPTGPIVIVFYTATAAFSLVTAALCRRLGEKIPIINKLTIGVYPK